MGRHVVDSSVILKWVLGGEREAGRDKALALLNARAGVRKDGAAL